MENRDAMKAGASVSSLPGHLCPSVPRRRICGFVVLLSVNTEQQLKLQAFLDGELPEQEARDMAALVARDAEAADLVAELRHTRAGTGRVRAGIEGAGITRVLLVEN